jgi:hypothetical protein
MAQEAAGARDEVGEKDIDKGTRPTTNTRGVEGSRGVEETCSAASIEGEGARVREQVQSLMNANKNDQHTSSDETYPKNHSRPHH